jgi:hypothetical protein
MNDTFIQECVNILKTTDIQHACRQLFKPVLDVLFYEMSNYIYMTISLIFLIFMMNLVTLVLLIYLLRTSFFTKPSLFSVSNL